MGKPCSLCQRWDEIDKIITRPRSAAILLRQRLKGRFKLPQRFNCHMAFRQSLIFGSYIVVLYFNAFPMVVRIEVRSLKAKFCKSWLPILQVRQTVKLLTKRQAPIIKAITFVLIRLFCNRVQKKSQIA